MTERVVADFVGRYVLDPGGGNATEPREGRVVMSRRRIVVAGADRHTVPVSAIVDVVVGNVPADLRGLFDDTVTVAYETEEGVRTVLVEGADDTIPRFVDVLFKCLLNGTGAVVRHPAKVGGRVTDVAATRGKLTIDDGRVRVATPDGEFEIDVAEIVEFDRTDRGPDGGDRPTLVATHVDDGEVVTSLVAPDSPRAVNLLGRFLRMEYSQLLAEARSVELDDAETRVLVAVYSTDEGVDLGELFEWEDARTADVLDGLVEKGLLDRRASTVALTPRGRIAATERFEDVND